MWASTEHQAGQLFADGGFLQHEREIQANELQQLSTEIRDFMIYVEHLRDPVQRETVRDGLKFLLRFHSLGLQRILDHLMANESETGTHILNQLIEDHIVSGLLLLHQLHPLDCRTRLLTALEKVGPYLDSHGVRVELLSLDNGIAKVRWQGGSDHLASIPATLELAIRHWVDEYCPDLAALQVEGMPDAVSTSKENHLHKESGRLRPVCEVSLLANGIPFFCAIEGIPIVICRTQEYIYAYRNICPACAMPLSTASTSGTIIQCTLGHSFDMQQAGSCIDDPAFRLEPFPLIAENGGVMVMVGNPTH